MSDRTRVSACVLLLCRGAPAGAVVLLPLPHALRARAYAGGDVPWAYDIRAGGVDRFGERHVPRVRGEARGGGV
jgi:hypothetical protein